MGDVSGHVGAEGGREGAAEQHLLDVAGRQRRALQQLATGRRRQLPGGDLSQVRARGHEG